MKAQSEMASPAPQGPKPDPTSKKRSDLDTRYLVPILDRTLDLLELLTQHPDGMSLSDLAKHLCIPKNSAFRITKTLTSRGYLEYEETSKHYSLGSKFLSLGLVLLDEESILEKSHDILKNLRDETKETALLGRIAGTHGIVLEQVLSSQPVKFHINIGHQFYLHTGAPGKAIVSFLPEFEQQALLEKLQYPVFNDRTISSSEKFRKVILSIRENGYAIDDEEEVSGLRCVAAPVFNHKNYPIAALWITAPSYRMPKSSFQKMAKTVLVHAERLSMRFGFHRLP